MAAPQKITDHDRFRKLYKAGCTLEELARMFDCGVATVERKVKAMGLTGLHGVDADPVLRPAKSEADLVAQLIATKGRYSLLAEIAAQQGWSQAKALQEFHKARRSA